MKRKCLPFILFAVLCFASSCLDKDRDLYVKLTNEQYFDFDMNQEVALSIDYGFAMKDFPIPVEQEKISDTYPDFTSWIASEGKKNKDWYKYP